jgi:antirestriction protein
MSAIYVGTYKKYNSGSIKGSWLELENYGNKVDFIQACLKVHADEADPELMFQDWEDIPAQYISESHIDEKVWAWLSLDEAERQVVRAYLDEIDHQAATEDILDSYLGDYDSEEDWAIDFWNQTGMTDEVPVFARNYIDYEQYARDVRLSGDVVFIEQNRKVRAYRR